MERQHESTHACKCYIYLNRGAGGGGGGDVADALAARENDGGTFHREKALAEGAEARRRLTTSVFGGERRVGAARRWRRRALEAGEEEVGENEVGWEKQGGES